MSGPRGDGDGAEHLKGNSASLEMGCIRVNSHKKMPNPTDLHVSWADSDGAETDLPSEEEEDAVGFEPRAVFASIQQMAIWTQEEIEECLRILPGSEALLQGGLLEDEARLLEQPHGETTGLMLAAWRGLAPLVNTLLEMGASPCVTDGEGRTPLHLAACLGHVECVAVLLRHGAPVKVWDSDLRATPLHCAASSGSLSTLRLLLNAGADVNAGLATSSSRTPLHYAVQSEAIDCVTELLRAGACPSTLQVYTETPLHVAAALGSAPCIRLLLEHGADPRVQLGERKITALHLAAEDESPLCAQLLLDAGAEVNARNARLQTPLHVAALSQNAETMELLLKRGADSNAEDVDGRTPLHSAIVKVCRSLECVCLLLNYGADVNRPDAFGYTPLHIAALNELSNCVNLLLTSGGDVTARTKGGVTALSFIVRRTPDVLPRLQAQLDNSIKLHDHEIGDVDCELKLDFRKLVPNLERGESGLLLTLIEVGQRHYLQHPLCQVFLFLKWKRIRKFFLFSLFFHALFVLLYSSYVVNVFLKDCPSSGSGKGCGIPACIKYLGYILLVFNGLLIAKELFQIAHSWTCYYSNWENWLQWLIVISVFPCVLHRSEATDVSRDVDPWQHHVAAIGIFLTWLELMMLVGRFPMFGLYVQMFTTVALNFAKFLFAYSCLLVAFGLSFGVLFPNYKAFKNVALGLMKTVVMMSGELEFEDIFYAEDAPITYPVTAHLLFLSFVLLVTVILTNLMVGLAVNDIQGLQQSAGLDRLVRQAQLVAHMESMLFSPLLHCMPKKLLTLCHRSALLTFSPYRNFLYIRPNDPRERRITRELIQLVYQLVAERRDKRHRNRYSSTASDTTERSICREKSYYEEYRFSIYNEDGSQKSTNRNSNRGSMLGHEVILDQILNRLSSYITDSEKRDKAINQRLKELSEQLLTLQKKKRTKASF